MLLIDDVDPRGNLNEWIEYLLDRSRWTRIMKKRIRVERSDFHFWDSGHDNTNENGRNNDSETPRRNTLMHRNDNAEDNYKTSPSRIIYMLVNANRRQSL